MPTSNQITTLDFTQNLYVNALNSPNKSSAVWDLSGQFNVMDYIFEIMTQGKPRQISSKDGYFEKPIMGRSTPTAKVSSATISGNTLILVFTDPNFTAFRYKEVLYDGTAANNQGRVIQKAPGTVTLEQVSGISGAFTAAQFAANATVSPLFPASGIKGSTGMEPVYEQPQYIHNQTAICRESLILYRRDLIDTYVKWAGDNWYMAQQPMMMRRFARELEKKAWFSKYGTTTNSTLEGNIQYSMGIREAILDPIRGGIYFPCSSTLSQFAFEGWMARIAARTNTGKKKVKIGCGRGFLWMVQQIYSQYVLYAGKDTTFNFGPGSIKGIDFYNLAFNGIEVELFIIPFFSDRETFPDFSVISGLGNFTRMEYTAIVFDENNYASVDGDMLPTIEKVYFGEAETEMSYIPGMIGSKLMGSSMYKGHQNLAVTDKDACSMELYTDVCHDTVAYNMGLFEVVV